MLSGLFSMVSYPLLQLMMPNKNRLHMDALRVGFRTHSLLTDLPDAPGAPGDTANETE